MDIMALMSYSSFWIVGGAFMVLGILIGWLFTRRGWRKRLDEAEARITDMQTAHRKERREWEEQSQSADQVPQLTAQVEQLQASLQAANDELETLRAQAAESGADESGADEPVQSDPAADDAADEEPSVPVAERSAEALRVDEEEEEEDEASELRMQLSLLQEEFDAATQNAAVELEETRTKAEALAVALTAMESDLETTKAEADAARQDAELLRAQIDEAGAGSKNKEIALNEAYEHAAAVQSQLKACKEEVAGARKDVEKMQAEVKALEAAKEELEHRVQNSRSDVAGDLAVLTSTMLKIKDDALDEANDRIAQLTEEVERLREQVD